MRVNPVMEIKEVPRLAQGREKELHGDYDRLRTRQRPYLWLTRRIQRRCCGSLDPSHGSRHQPRLLAHTLIAAPVVGVQSLDEIQRNKGGLGSVLQSRVSDNIKIHHKVVVQRKMSENSFQVEVNIH